jgi:subtilisin-like proprotein convertase family protein
MLERSNAVPSVEKNVPRLYTWARFLHSRHGEARSAPSNVAASQTHSSTHEGEGIKMQGNEASGNRPSGPARALAALAALVLVVSVAMATTITGSGTGSGLARPHSKSLGSQSSSAAPRVARQVNTSGSQTVALRSPEVIRAAHSDTSPPLRSIKPVIPSGPPAGVKEHEVLRIPGSTPPFLVAVDPVVQDYFGPLAMPTPILSFQGYRQQDNFDNNNGLGVLPPDTEGDIGPNHYVQWVNIGLRIFDKSGNTVLGPVNGNTLWSGFPGTCAAQNDGDPVVLYDSMAGRWLLSQFSIPTGASGPSYECIAISTSGDPTGSYYRYEFQTHPAYFEDYPHFGVWPDAYYMSMNEFSSLVTFAGAGSFAFDRARMLAGDPSATMQYFHVDAPFGGMLPSDLDGATLPPAGSPNYFVEVDDEWGSAPQDRLSVFEFHVDWANPSNSTFTGPVVLGTAPFDSDLCTGSREACIPQAGTTVMLEAITDRLMWRLAYRNYGDPSGAGTHESLVINHTVDADGAGRAGVRWYELRDPGGSPVIYQQGTYAPADGNFRWMGSASMDRDGNVALGYSLSSPLLFPQIRYTGRLSSDPLGTMPQGEATLHAGSGSQTRSDAPRWGDYSMISIDPTDDCTFWYTQEYYEQTSSASWTTRVGSFRFPSCGAGPPTPTVTGTPPTAVPTHSPTASRTSTATPTPSPTAVCVLAYQSGDVPKIIPDVITVTSSLNIQSGPIISRVDVVGLAIGHTWPEDLDVFLVSPAGTRVELFTDVCGGDPDWTQANTGFDLSDAAPTGIGSTCPPGTGAYRPEGSLGALAGQPSSGTWTLEIKDDTVQDIGNLYAWGLRIYSNQPCASPVATHTPTITPTPGQVLVGHVTWEGRPPQPDALQQLPITVTLKSSSTEANYPAQVTDASGYFTVSLGSLPAGTYTWRVKGPHGQTQTNAGPGFLAGSGTTTLEGLQVDRLEGSNLQTFKPSNLRTTSVEMGLMRAGDADNDNVVDVLDFNLLKGAFGRPRGDPGYDARPDFNGDDVVDVLDFNLLKGNFGVPGAAAAGPNWHQMRK